MEQLGRYQIVDELGRGAMGVVFRALDPSIGREVALKTIRLGEFASVERNRQRERLFREARSAGILSHPGIVTIYDAGEQEGVAYIAMEIVRGPTLDRVLSSGQPLAPEQMFRILQQNADALDYAHRKGIVHRDIKPANIMVDENGAAKITDFGVAKMTSLDQLTQIGLIVGTPNYMSPEQVQGKPITGRVDQYALAVIVYEILTGEKPFTADHLPTLVYKIVSEEPVSPVLLNRSLGPEIDAVLRKALAKVAEDRFATCAEFVNALEAACAKTRGWKCMPRGGSLSLPTLSTEVDPGSPDSPTLSWPTPVTPQRETDLPLKRRFISPIAAGILIGLGFAGVALYNRLPLKKNTPAPVAAAPPPQESAPVPAPVPKREARVPAPKQTTAAPEPAPPAPKPVEPAKPQPAPVQPPRASAPKPAVQWRKPDPAATAVAEIPVQTQPPGATVVLDGGVSCVTPCVVTAKGGNHVLSVRMAGYRDVNRNMTVTSELVDLPVIALQPLGGVVLVQSEPGGASITVDGKLWPRRTPAELRLPPGRHELVVESGALRGVKTVEVRDNDLQHITVPLAQP
ncbi:MAG: serine/threonine protein kinase [Candidatus Solibacter usitatus]|nr:serine/threonine protein kinase [Candidatus Solibacter usitatus]